MDDSTQPYHAFIGAHKMLAKGPSDRQKTLTDVAVAPDEEEIQLRLKFLWTAAFSLSAQSATAQLSSSMLEKLVQLASDCQLNLPISFWRRVCPHCLSFYHVSGYTIPEWNDVSADRTIEMDRIIGKDAPNSLSAALSRKKGPFVIYICDICAGGAKWMLPLK
ncbi:hypothetical protein MDAP_000335 [Mitosporidium daphniae]|uniref:Uncharacterized protein n=1 Tax=Mitosporidium daphniae TaxID=1485682 RepID=A0A098VTR6_9MICR|nr:uncharacterized protein DI09_188p40 [Mitosporidium daphniae]KGG52335.1 hypothetical protein DI09_188p40 [Mitosporidium daphniae]|eukprot:XP_013238771.1 uncharacterized protein DI09_188p40 [Mitosporidium daphniae]